MNLTESKNKALYLYLAIWFVIGLIQSYFMDLSGEEAYYYLFSERLDWGYMDHPPAVAFFTKIGYTLFQNNLGARLMMTVLNTLTLLLVYKTVETEKKDPWLFIYISASLIAVHAGSFLIKTDGPLIFFEALFFWAYKKYLEKENTFTISILIVSIAGMLLSKYHGVLIVFFVLLSNLQLVKKKSIYLVTLGVIVLMLPHFYWLYKHDWLSIKFHLQGRADLGFKWKNVTNYLYTQPIVLGPLTSIILIPVAFIYKSKNKFDKALKYTFYGVLLFFFYNSFKIYVHKHWTSIAMLPLMILGYKYLANHQKLSRVVKYLSIATLVLVLPIRAYLTYDFIPDNIDGKVETLHRWELWGQEIDSLAQKRNIVFVNSYENASRFTYLTQRKSHCLSTYYFNNTHFDTWPIEDTLQGTSVFLIDKKGDQTYTKYKTKIGEKVKYKLVDNYRSYAKVNIATNWGKKEIFEANQTITLPIVITNNQPYSVSVNNNPNLVPKLNAYFMQHYKTRQSEIVIDSLELKPGETQKTTIQIKTPRKIGKYQFRLAVQAGDLPPTINSLMHQIEIK